MKRTVEQVAAGIREREIGETISYRVVDPACWKEDGGPSIAARFAAARVVFREADNSRISGWDQVRDRLIGEDLPMLYFPAPALTLSARCRRYSTMRHGPRMSIQTEDHAGDELRYACVSRPLTRTGIVDRYARPRQRPARRYSHMAA